MNSKRKKRLIFGVLGLGVLIYTAVSFIQAEKEISKISITPEIEMPKDYLSLFNSSIQKNIFMQYGASFNLRNAIISLSVNDKYYLEMTKSAVRPEFNIATDIIEERKEAKGCVKGAIFPNHHGIFNITYKANSQDTVSKIYLTLLGDSLRTLCKNDSIAYYYLKLKNGYIQFQPKGALEMSIESKKKMLFKKERPIIIAFLKRNKFLYYIFLSNSTADSDVINPNILFSLLR